MLKKHQDQEDFRQMYKQLSQQPDKSEQIQQPQQQQRNQHQPPTSEHQVGLHGNHQEQPGAFQHAASLSSGTFQSLNPPKLKQESVISQQSYKSHEYATPKSSYGAKGAWTEGMDGTFKTGQSEGTLKLNQGEEKYRASTSEGTSKMGYHTEKHAQGIMGTEHKGGATQAPHGAGTSLEEPGVEPKWMDMVRSLRYPNSLIRALTEFQYIHNDAKRIPYNENKLFGGYKDPERHFKKLPADDELHFNGRRYVDQAKEKMREIDKNTTKFPKGSKEAYLEKEYHASRLVQTALEKHHRGKAGLDPYDEAYIGEQEKKERLKAKAERAQEWKAWFDRKSIRRLETFFAGRKGTVHWDHIDDARDTILKDIYRKGRVAERTVSEVPGGIDAQASEAGSEASKTRLEATDSQGRKSVPHPIRKLR